MLRNIRIAVCGDLTGTCEMLRREGVSQIDLYSDALDLSMELRRGTKYHMVLVYAPHGSGLGNTEYSYKTLLEGEWNSVPVRLMDEPACHAELTEMKVTLRSMALAGERSEA